MLQTHDLHVTLDAEAGLVRALGERRANAARDFLQAQGVPVDRLLVTSWGKERPVAAGSDETAWAQNRRAVTVIVR